MAMFLEHAYSIVHQDNAADQPTLQDLKTQLEKGTDETKLETMKTILTIMLNGDPMPQLLMHIIRFVMPSKSKPLKKLLYLYYEICPKLDSSGKLKQEMILVWYVNYASAFTILADFDTVTVYEETCNIRTNISEATHYASSARCANPNSLSLFLAPPGYAWNTDMPMFARMPCWPCPRSISSQNP